MMQDRTGQLQATAPVLTHQTQRNARSQAATRIQAIFRGYRTRQRIVWGVRTELSAFMESIEQELEVERLFLGLHKPQSSRWLYDCTGEYSLEVIDVSKRRIKNSLHLPRIEDDVFGMRYSFPQPPVVPLYREDENTSLHSEEKMHDTEESARESTSSASEVASCLLEDAGAIDSQPTQCTDDSQDANDLSARTGNDDNACTSTESSVDLLAVSAHNLSPRHEPSIVGSTSISPTAPLLTVTQVIATHSKAEILKELAWTKQALRDRIRYLHALKRA
jgi:hypothetical protein